jgi:hypothetical protein
MAFRAPIIVALACLSIASVASAEDAPDPCALAAELTAQVTDLNEQIAFLIRDAKPYCKAKTKQCKEKLAELYALQSHAEQLNIQRHEAQAACDKRK